MPILQTWATLTEHLHLFLAGELARDFLVCLLQQPEHALCLLVLVGRQLPQGACADVHHCYGPALVVTQGERQVTVAVRVRRHRLRVVHALEEVVSVGW